MYNIKIAILKSIARLACRRWNTRKGADLRLGSARRGCPFDAPTHHPDAEAFRSEYSTSGRAQGTFGRPEGRDASYGAPVRHVSFLFPREKGASRFEKQINAGEKYIRLFWRYN